MATVRDALALALDHHLAGRLVEAETLYGRILEVASDNADALHLHGVLCAQTGRLPRAVALLADAIRVNGAVPDYHVNLANALRAGGRAAEAVPSYRRALALAPGRADAGFGLALALAADGQRDATIAAYREMLRHHPSHAQALNNLGLALRDAGTLAEAAERLAEAGRLAPLDAGIHANLGFTLARLPGGSGAAAAFRRALMLEPAFAQALTGLAGQRPGGGDPRAEQWLRRSLRNRAGQPGGASRPGTAARRPPPTDPAASLGSAPPGAGADPRRRRGMERRWSSRPSRAAGRTGPARLSPGYPAAPGDRRIPQQSGHRPARGRAGRGGRAARPRRRGAGTGPRRCPEQRGPDGGNARPTIGRGDADGLGLAVGRRGRRRLGLSRRHAAPAGARRGRAGGLRAGVGPGPGIAGRAAEPGGDPSGSRGAST